MTMSARVNWPVHLLECELCNKKMLGELGMKLHFKAKHEGLLIGG